MGEEKKEEGKRKRINEEAKEEEKKKDEKPQEIILQVDMHCEACTRKVTRSLKGFQGVEDVTVDCKASKVVVKGNAADPLKDSKENWEKVELISPPLPKPPEESNKEKLNQNPKKKRKWSLHP